MIHGIGTEVVITSKNSNYFGQLGVIQRLHRDRNGDVMNYEIELNDTTLKVKKMVLAPSSVKKAEKPVPKSVLKDGPPKRVCFVFLFAYTNMADSSGKVKRSTIEAAFSDQDDTRAVVATTLDAALAEIDTELDEHLVDNEIYCWLPDQKIIRIERAGYKFTQID